MWIVVVDTMQIQPYIFGSNRLRENVGASYLVAMATGDWAFDAVEAAVKEGHGKTNIEAKNQLIEDSQKRPREDVRIEKDLVDTEVWYAGGGNFVVFFKEEYQVKKFNYYLSRQALEEAPNLQLVIAQEEIDLRKHILRDKLDEVMRKLALRKRNHAWSAPLLGLSVTLSCSSTNFPATGMVPGIRGEPDYPASDEIRAKVRIATPHGGHISLADKRLQEVIGQQKEYLYPADFDELGATKGEYSHIAIVHADGNGMGKRIRAIGEPYTTPDKNREYIQKLREFSFDVERASRKALKTVLHKLVERIDDKQKAIVYQLTEKTDIRIELERKGGRYYLPFRPIVFGGDDVTFVCDGRLGLSLATAYLHQFEKETSSLSNDAGSLTACAGIAVVKSHYPFARAYGLATDLTASAKSYRSDHANIVGSCLDWHFALSGLSGSIKDIRDREYQVRAGCLTLRPVTLDTTPNESVHTWPVVRKGIDAFQKEQWVERRNKIKALRDALRQGPSAVEHFITAFNENESLPPVLTMMRSWSSTGWQGSTCGYFDAIELADWFVPLEERESEQ